MSAFPTPPVARLQPEEIHLHGDLIVDNYRWLERRADPAVLEYLEAENAYTRAVLEPLRPLSERLYAEMRGRIKEDDRSVPLKRGDYEYYTRTEQGQQYPLYCRRRGPDGPEELLIDGPELAASERFFRVGAWQPSPDQSLLAYVVDTSGALVYTLYIKDLRSGALLAAPIGNVDTCVEWSEDGQNLWYVTFDHAHRAYKLYRHRLGSPNDSLVYHEADESLDLMVQKTRSRAFMLIELRGYNTTEVHYAPADQPDAPFTLLAPRQPKIEYSVTHQGDDFLIVSNEAAENFRLFAAPTANPARPNWRELVAHRADTLIDGVDAFANYLVLYERRGGLQQIRISDPDGTNERAVLFPEPVYTIVPGPNVEYSSDSLRFSYSSLVTPKSVIDYGMADGAWQLRKQAEIPSGYDPGLYVAERLEVPTPDGARVPISLVYRRGLVRDGSNPALLIAYGAYGSSYDPEFDARRLSLLDRGFVFGIAHIRGGAELGRAWYEQGRMLNKKNTFSDFICCAEELIAKGYTSPAQLAISGTSAGGLLMSAVANARPDLFCAVLARVPWTNVIAALIQADLPLTVPEWEQWGNPAIEAQYRYLRSYDPYQHVAAMAYPHIMATAGLNDLQVPYWDPAKWVARLRAMKTDDRMLILRTNMAAGHGGASGRFSFLEESAQEYAFLLAALGRADEAIPQAE